MKKFGRNLLFASLAGFMFFSSLFSMIFYFREDAKAAINEQINYQGRLLDSTGGVVPDGTYNMRFKIYSGGDGVLGGGDETLEWTETRQNSASQGVTVRNGYYSVNLGSITSFGTSVDWNTSTLWISVDVAGTGSSGSPTYDGELSPFKRLAAVPYALNSSLFNGLQSTNFVQLAQGVQTDSSASNASIFINKTGATADILNLQRAGTSVLLIGNGGSTAFKTTTDSTTGFQINDADGGTPVFNVDTTNERVGIGTTSPATALDVNGTATATLFSGSGASLTSLNASNISSGTLADGRLSANVSLLGSSISGSEIVDNTIEEVDLEVTNTPTDNYVLTYDSASGGFTWEVDDDTPSGSAGGDLTGTYPNPTIAANAVALGTDTTGNYVANVTGNSQISVGGSAGEGWTPTLSIATDSIGDTQLTYNTGQHLTTSSAPTFTNVKLSDQPIFDGSIGAQKEENVNGVNVTGAGWYKVATITGAAGRGQNTVTVYTTGGSYGPQSTTIRWWHDWSTTAGITVLSETGASYWSQARVTDDGSNAYLEVYFTQAISSQLSLSLQYDGGYARAGTLYSGTLPAGSGTVRATATTGLLAIGSDKFLIDNSGNVGIGTTSPGSLLHLNGSNVNLRVADSSATGNPKISLYQDTGERSFIQYDNTTTTTVVDSDDKIGLNTNNTRAATILSSGNFGIGDDTPSYKLDVAGDIATTTLLRVANTAASPGGTGILLPYQTSTPNGGPAVRWSDGTVANTFGFYVYGGVAYQGNSANPDFMVRQVTGSGSSGSINTLLNGNATPGNSYINALGGNVGIGDTSPAALLTVGSGDKFQVDSAGVLTAPANEYIQAQFTMTGGGTVSWATPGGKLKWTSRLIAIPVARTTTTASGYIQMDQPTTNIPSGQVYDGLARTADANGVVLNAWEALYAEHTPGGGITAITYRIVRYTNDFRAPSNWILIAAVSGDNNTVRLGTGQILPANSSTTNGVESQYIASGATAGGDLTGTYPNPTIAANAVALGTDTTGNYVGSVTGNSQISVGGSAGEGWTPTLSIATDSIGDTQLAFDTGQNLTTTSSPTFGGLTVNGLLKGGLGASSTGGTLDWNDSTNSASGSGTTLLLGSATNGPGGGNYFHPINFEYITKNGTGNVTQLAVPYGDETSINEGIKLRGRYSAAWSSWTNILSSNTNGNYGVGTSGTPSDLLSVGGTTGNFLVNSTGNLTVGAASGTGLNFSNSGITTDINLQNSETIDNNTDGTIALTATTTSLSGNLSLSNSGIASFGSGTGDKLQLYSNTYGVGIESGTLTNWSNAQFRWRTGGTSVSTGTERAVLSTTLLSLNNGVGLSVAGDATVSGGNLILGSTDISEADIDALDDGLISGSEIVDNTIEEADLEVTNAPTDNYVLSYDSGTGGFTWVVDGDTPSGAAGGDLTGTYPNPTLAANSVALTTDTTGNYVANVTGNSQISVGGSAGEGWTPTLSIQGDSIGDTQLQYNTGQHLTTTSTPTFGGLTVNGDASVTSGLKVGGQFISNSIYSYANGVLIATDIAVGDNRMIDLIIEGNSYSNNGPIQTKVQAYNFVTTGTIIQTSGIAEGPTADIDVFHYGGYVYFWTQQSSAFQTMRFRLNSHTGNHKITAITNEAKPVSGVTNSVTITPSKAWNAINDGASSGLDADLLDGLSSASFLQSGATAGGDLTGTYPNPTLAANSVALTTDTTGNYVQSANTSVLTGLTGGSAGSEGAALTLGFDYSQALSGDPALAANAGVFGQSGLVFEGSTANTAETFLAVTNPTADRTITFPDTSGEVSLLGSSISGSEIVDNTIEEVDLEVTNTPTDNYILTYDSASGGFTWEVDQNTTYSAGNDLDLSGTTFDIESQLDSVSTISRASSNLTLQTTTSGDVNVSPAGDFNVDSNTLYVDSSANSVGIRNSSPVTPLDIDTQSNLSGIRLRGAAETTEIADIYINGGGALVLSTENTGAATSYIEADTEDDQFGLIIRESSAGSDTYANLYMNDASTDYLNIVTNATNSTLGLVVDDDNQVGIGIADPAYKLDVDGNINAANDVRGDSLYFISGTQPNNFTLCYTGSSPYRVARCTSTRDSKKNIEDLEIGLSTINQLRPVYFEGRESSIPDLGFIAEEVNETEPLLAVKEEDGDLIGVKYEHMSALLAKGIQELDDKVEKISKTKSGAGGTNASASEITELSEKVDDLTKRLDEIAPESDGAVQGLSTINQNQMPLSSGIFGAIAGALAVALYVSRKKEKQPKQKAVPFRLY